MPIKRRRTNYGDIDDDVYTNMQMAYARARDARTHANSKDCKEAFGYARMAAFHAGKAYALATLGGVSENTRRTVTERDLPGLNEYFSRVAQVCIVKRRK